MAVTAMVALLVLGLGACETSLAKSKKHRANWPTYHANLARTGVDTSSPPLGQLSRSWTAQLDGQVYAEPLVVGSRVYAATENNSVYALNARTGRVMWRRNLGVPVDASTLPCGNITPVTGITGTPAISGDTLYVVAFLGGYRHVLFGLNLNRGKIEFRRAADAPGSDPRVHQQRSALSVSHGRVYVPFGGLAGDCGDYKGRVVSVRTRRPRKPRVFTVGVGREGAIWAPSGAAVDRQGNLFVTTGNGDSSGFDYGNSVLRLSRGLALTSFFRPPNAGQLNDTDTDLGSVGPTLLGGGLMFAIGKEGVGVVLSTGQLGGVGGQVFQQLVCQGGAYGGLAYLPPLIFVPCSTGLVAVRSSGAQFGPAWRVTSADGPPIVAGGVVWSINIGSGTLNGFAPDSGALLASAPLGSVTHFATPSAGGGRLFAPANTQVIAFTGV
jgi:putative pyrroloquinoline-quinone-binding quinoprotein